MSEQRDRQQRATGQEMSRADESQGVAPGAELVPQVRVQVIVNPASGPDRPMLSILNSVFQELGIRWDVSVTQQAGDAQRLAREAAAAGVDVVAVYGGDGTVMEAATGLVGSAIPLAILPGGTANALALALGIPVDLAAAARLIGLEGRQVREIDLGKLGEDYFLVAVGIGIPGQLAEQADREAKDRLGLFAYVLQSLQATAGARPAHYRLTIDGEEIEREGVACIVANASNFGLPGLTLSSAIDMSDGLLDLFVMPSAALGAVLSLLSSVVRQDETTAPYEHWQARRISVVTEPPQAIQMDGEVRDSQVVEVNVVPRAIRVIVPAPPPEEATG